MNYDEWKQMVLIHDRFDKHAPECVGEGDYWTNQHFVCSGCGMTLVKDWRSGYRSHVISLKKDNPAHDHLVRYWLERAAADRDDEGIQAGFSFWETLFYDTQDMKMLAAIRPAIPKTNPVIGLLYAMKMNDTQNDLFELVQHNPYMLIRWVKAWPAFASDAIRTKCSKVAAVAVEYAKEVDMKWTPTTLYGSKKNPECAVDYADHFKHQLTRKWREKLRRAAYRTTGGAKAWEHSMPSKSITKPYRELACKVPGRAFMFATQIDVRNGDHPDYRDACFKRRYVSFRYNLLVQKKRSTILEDRADISHYDAIIYQLMHGATLLR